VSIFIYAQTSKKGLIRVPQIRIAPTIVVDKTFFPFSMVNR